MFVSHMGSDMVNYGVWISSVQSFSRVQLFATQGTAARQASLSITNSQSLLKLMSIESVMPSNHLIFCHPLLLLPSIFPSMSVFSRVSSSHQVAKLLEFQLQHQSFQWTFRGCSFRMDWLDLLAVQRTRRVFSSTTVQKHQFFGAQPSSQSNSHIHTWPQEKP